MPYLDYTPAEVAEMYKRLDVAVNEQYEISNNIQFSEGAADFGDTPIYTEEELPRMRLENLRLDLEVRLLFTKLFASLRECVCGGVHPDDAAEVEGIKAYIAGEATDG